MGIEVQAVRLLLLAREMGADFSASLMIGRQDLLVTGETLRATMADFGETLTASEGEVLALGRDRFAEPLFERLGARTVDSMDASDFEQATIVHDLNRPRDPALDERFSLVFDGGTLEHVFNVPEALRTTMSAVRVGGHLLMALPANNQMGHGFYQFSPDFFWRVLSPENGYRMQAMFLAAPFGSRDWLAVRDPAAVRSRIGHNAPREAQYVWLIAERTAAVPLFVRAPQQSDYAAEWTDVPAKGGSTGRLAFFDQGNAAAERQARASGLRRALRDAAPKALLRHWRAYRVGRGALAAADGRHLVPFVARAGSAPPT